MTERRSPWTLAAFAAPCLPLAALGLPLVVYLPEYYVSELGLSLGVVGAAFLTVKLLAIILDPLLGGLMDRTRSSLGRFRPWMLAAVPLLMLSVYGLFMAKPGVSAIYLWIFLIIIYPAYSAATLAHTAWASVLSPDYQQRSRIFGWWQGGNVSGMILVLLLPPILALAFKGDHASGVQAMGWFVVLLLPMTAALAVMRVDEPAAARPHVKATAQQYLEMFRRPSVIRLLLADLLMGLAPGIAGSLFFFFFERIKGFNKTEAGVMLLVYFIAALGGSSIWPVLARKVGKHKALAVASIAYAIVQVAAVITPAHNVVIGLFVLILAGLPYSAAPVLVRSMMADIGDEERLANGADRTGLLYALVSGTVKLGYALSVGAFLMLAWLGFDPKVPSAEGDAALIGLYAFAPAALGVVVCLIMLRYPLDAKAHAEIRRQLDARDAAEFPSTVAPEKHVPATSALAAQTPAE